MDAAQIQELGPLLQKFLRRFDGCFGRSEPRDRLRTYVTGQLSDLPRKSIEPMADAAGVPPRTLQQFLSLAEWDEDRMRDTLLGIVAAEHAHPRAIGVIDETGHPKKGDKTPGVQRQYCGATGKVDNCIVTVHLNYTAGEFHCLLDGELFLPESWSVDPKRCREAGIPDDMVHRPKWQISLELWRHARSQGVVFAWMTFDEAYGEVPAFLFTLDDAGQYYVGEIPTTFAAWAQKPRLLHEEAYSGKGRKFHVKDTTLGPVVWEAKEGRIYLKRDGLPTAVHRLVIARNVLKPEEVKYFISNAPREVSLETLLHVGFSRWHVERCFEDGKGELGLSHFEVRNYRSLKRHLIVTAVSYLFLARVRQAWRGEKSGADDLPVEHGDLRDGAILVDDRKGPAKASRTDRRDHHTDPATSGTRPPIPSQAHAKTVA
jgi:SRSO17 transposase